MEITENTTASPRLRIAVLGPGGVGGLLAAVLAHAGHDVVCLAGESTAEALRAKGIDVRSELFGEFTAAVDADTQLRHPVDLCLITVKQTALEPALDRVAPSELGDGLVVPFLNGVEHPARLRERYRPELVAPATIRVESTRVEPGLIEHTSSFADIELASSTTPRARLDSTAAALNSAGLPTIVREDEVTTLWSKIAFLAPFALLTTRYMATIGEIRARHWDELLDAGAEVAAVAAASGAEINGADVRRLFENVPDYMKSSMLRDAEAGRSLELDAIGGSILRAGVLHGVPVPVVTSLVLYLAARHGISVD